jgi:cyclophilin family peptidyl-prolyl cis-trans isomerase
MALLGSTIGLARPATVLSPQEIAAAEWSRDTHRLLDSAFEAEDLTQVAVALGRTRDPAACDRLALLASGTDAAVAEAAAPGLGWAGCVAAARTALGVERRPAVRAGLWHALAAAGGAEDVPLAMSALTGPDAAQAAYTLGRLGQRGVVEARTAGAALVGLLDLPGDRARMAAFALFRNRQAPLSPVAHARLQAAWPRMADGAAKAWLVPVVLGGLEGSERAAFVAVALSDPSRLVRAAVVGAATPDDLPGDRWTALLSDEDVWLRLQARGRLGLDDVDPFQPGDRLPQLYHLSALAPAQRTRLVGWMVEHDPTDAEITAAAESPDPVVRELLVDLLNKLPAVRDRVLLGAETSSLRVTAIDALGAATDRLKPPVVTWLTEQARRGPFVVRDHAAALLTTLKLPVPEAVGPRPAPGPVDLQRDLSVIRTFRVADVVTTQGVFRIDLDPETAPLAVSAFVWLAKHGDLNSTLWHRVVPGFVAQTGCPRGDGMGGPDWFLADEVSTIPFDAGSVGMARSGRDTGASQWFVTTSPQPHLAGDYTRFGEVSDGLDVVMRLGTDDRVLSVQIQEQR